MIHGGYDTRIDEGRGDALRVVHGNKDQNRNMVVCSFHSKGNNAITKTEEKTQKFGEKEQRKKETKTERTCSQDQVGHRSAPEDTYDLSYWCHKSILNTH